jgi:hypothetical protein
MGKGPGEESGLESVEHGRNGARHSKRSSFLSWPLPLSFRRGSALLRTQLAVKAFLVNGPPVLIGLAGFERHGSQQMRQIRSRGLEGGGILGMNRSPGANHQIAQETVAQGHGGGKMCEAMFKV